VVRESDDRLREATSVLLLAPDVRDRATTVTASLLERESRDFDHVVGVTVTESASSWVRAWRRHADAGTRVSCVDVDGRTRAVAGDGGEPVVPSVESVEDPTDLEALGRTVSDVLERSAEGDERIGLAVHSVSDLLHHVDESTAFKFVYTLGEVVRRVDGTVYFHVDPRECDSPTVDTFAAACDAVVHLERGDVTVTTPNDW
jgi:KaiC/GvpD/RAD55 family RecA-like ATPase